MDGKDKASNFIQEQKYKTCLEVVNSAYPQNHPARKEAAHMFAQGGRAAGINEGTSDYGALVTFYQHCCAKVHGSPKPPENDPPMPASQAGALAVTAKDFSDFGVTISNLMTKQVQSTLGDAASLFRQQHTAGPAALTAALAKSPNFYQLNPTDVGEECEPVLGIEDDYLEAQLEALMNHAGDLSEKDLPHTRMWGAMEAQVKSKGYLKSRGPQDRVECSKRKDHAKLWHRTQSGCNRQHKMGKDKTGFR